MAIEEEDKTTLQSVIQPGHLGSETDKTRFESHSSNSPQLTPAQTTGAGIQGAIDKVANGAKALSVPADSGNYASVGLNIGDLLKNRFQIVECLGQGGMGMVFKAQDIRKVEAKAHNTFVAIKVLNPALAQNQLLVAGLQRESEKAQELSHPNIITVYDFDRDGDLVFMSMEYLSGQPLSEMIRESAPMGGIHFKHAWPLILEMATALSYAHRRNIVHSDFKPANVIITKDHKVKVLDFGIASRTEKGHDVDATIFNARAEGGHTPTYASFEMMNGAKADPRDDIYAFGLVVYEMLTGKHPYHRKPASEVFIEQQKFGKTKLDRVKGLSRRQWQALKSSIEILQDKRPGNLDEWLEQFDPKTGRWSPQLLGGVVAIVLITVSFSINRWLSTPVNDRPVQDLAAVSQSPPIQSNFKLPVANAGSDQSAQLGMTVFLDASGSQTGDGDPIQYDWRLIQTPSGSLTTLQNANLVNPQLIPDKVGEYIVELLVRDQHNSSQPARVQVMVLEPVKPMALHETTSSDGVLSLAASKAQYRIGEQLRLNIQVLKSGYLRVAYISASGEVSELFPNQHQPSKVKADTEYVIPPKGKFKLEITGPAGVDKIVAVYSESPMTNLEKVVDASGQIDSQNLQNKIVAAIQYTVVK